MLHELHDRLTETFHRQLRTVSVGLACLAVLAAFSGMASAGTVATHRVHQRRWNAQNASQSTAPLIVTHDVVVSGDNPLGPGQSDCGLTNQLYHGEKAVFRVKVIDPKTGKPMGKSQLEGVTIHVTSGGGKTLEASYEKHGNDTFWVAPWVVPSSFPSGPVNYTISVNGQHVEPVQFNVQESELTVLNKSVKSVNQQQGSGQSGKPASLPLVFWVVVGVVAVVVVGLVWNGERQ